MLLLRIATFVPPMCHDCAVEPVRINGSGERGSPLECSASFGRFLLEQHVGVPQRSELSNVQDIHAILYRDDIQILRANVLTTFPLPGGHIEEVASNTRWPAE